MVTWNFNLNALNPLLFQPNLFFSIFRMPNFHIDFLSRKWSSSLEDLLRVILK